MPAVKPTETQQWRQDVEGFIRGRMISLGYNNEDIAKRLNINVRTLCLKLANPENITFGEVLRLARILQCEPVEILSGQKIASNGHIERAIITMSGAMQVILDMIIQDKRNNKESEWVLEDESIEECTDSGLIKGRNDDRSRGSQDHTRSA